MDLRLQSRCWTSLVEYVLEHLHLFRKITYYATLDWNSLSDHTGTFQSIRATRQIEAYLWWFFTRHDWMDQGTDCWERLERCSGRPGQCRGFCSDETIRRSVDSNIDRIHNFRKHPSMLFSWEWLSWTSRIPFQRSMVRLSERHNAIAEQDFNSLNQKLFACWSQAASLLHQHGTTRPG